MNELDAVVAAAAAILIKSEQSEQTMAAPNCPMQSVSLLELKQRQSKDSCELRRRRRGGVLKEERTPESWS